MKPSSKYFDSIRISKGKKKPGGNARPTTSANCQWQGCERPGTHKAPVGRNREGQYLNFCIDHVREYNKSYNYFSGLPDDDVAKIQKDALTGGRPTWTMGVNKDGNAAPYSEGDPRAEIADRIIRRSMRRTGQLKGAGVPLRKLKPLEKKAFEDLGMPQSATPTEIKTEYKALVKRHHPDLNGGDRAAEERLSQIIKSYKILKQGGFCT